MNIAFWLGKATATTAGVLLLAACAAAPRPASTAPATPPAISPGTRPPGSGGTGAAAATALDGCLSPARATISKVRGNGETLTLGILGTGPRVIVMSNESDENLCSWLPVATRLAGSGYRVVLWDYGGNLPADELTSLVTHLRSAGAARIVLMGASEGAKVSLVAGARITPRVQGVVSLSAESVLRPATIVADWVRRLTCPLLLVTARQDPYGSAQAAPDFMAAARNPDKRLVTVPGSDHGTALLAGPAAAATRAAIIAFLRRQLP